LGIAYYARSLVYPTHLIADITAPVPSWQNAFVWIGVAVTALWTSGLIAALALRQYVIGGLCLLGIVSLGPTLGLIVPLFIPIAGRFMYLPAMWFWLTIVIVASRAPSRYQRLKLALVMVIPILSMTTIARNADYRDDSRLYAGTVANAERLGWGLEPGYFVLEN